ncbi:MAG TPA: relaxase/mobilization nuclease domain-containing protein, partial [Thermoanaerobaculia bacterium]|nr:relaxase/mobilization nuclease domain-containing protein [Thermoanaerobaculia bacterium]
MIHSISKGQGFGGCVRYVRNKPGAEIIGGSFERTASASEISAHLGRQAHEAELTSKPIFHASLNLRPGEVLTDQQWRQAARTYLDALGFTDCPYLLVRHTDRKHDHVHIVASRVSEQGKLVSDSGDYKKGMEVLRRIEKDLKLQPPVRVHRDQDKTPSRAEYQRDRRTGQENLRGQLQTLVRNAAADKPDLSTFARRLRASGVEVRLKTSGEQVRGISFDYRRQSFRGSSLGRSYSWGALQKNHGLTFDPARHQHLLRSKPPQVPTAWSPEVASDLGARLAMLRPGAGRSVVAQAGAALRSDGGQALQTAANVSRIVSVVRNPGRALLRQLPGGSALLSGLSLYGAFTNPQVALSMAAGLAVNALAAAGRPSRSTLEGDARTVLQQYVRAALADRPTPETFLARLSEAGIALRTNTSGTWYYSAGGLEVPLRTLGATVLPANLEMTPGGPLDRKSSSAVSAVPEASQDARRVVEQHLSALNASHVDIRIGTGSGSQLLARLSPSEVLDRLPELADSYSRGLVIAVRPSSGTGAHFVGWTSPDQLARAAAAGFQPAAVVQDGSKLAVWVQHAPAGAEVRPFLERAVQLAYAQPGTPTARAFGPLAGIGPSEKVLSAHGVCYGRAQTLAAELTAARAERTAALAAKLASLGVPRLQTYSAAVGGSSKAVDLAWTRLAVSRGLQHGDILAVLAQNGAHRLSSPINQLTYATRTLGAALGQHPASPALLRSAAAVAMP